MTVSQSLNKYMEGAIAGGITITTLQPLFTVVNLTMSGVRIPAFLKSPSFFWGGLVPNLVAEMASQAISLGTYNFMAGRVDNRYAAMIAGGCNAPILTPLERLMVKQQLLGGSSIEMVKRICRTEGVRYLFKGFSPTMVREIIFAYTAYHSSDKIGETIHRYVPYKKPADVAAQIGLGALCGVLTTPFSLIAVKMQANETKIGVSRVISQIFKEEGLAGFFKGYKERAILISFLMVGMKQSQALVSEVFQ
jgi:hypothetical protein